jgi:hypothetical protein
MLHGVDIQPPSSRFYENVTSTNAERPAAGKLPAAAADSPPELARLQLQAAELAGARTILMVPLCKDGRLLGDDAEAAQFPDLLARSSEILRDLHGIALGDPPVCRPQRAGFRAEGRFRRSREVRLASARIGDGVRRRDDAALVAPPHSAVSGGSSNFRAANQFLRRELGNGRMKPPRLTGAWPVSDGPAPSSSANAGSRSEWPSAQRYSITRFRPST